MFRRLYLLLISISCTLSVFGAELPLATSYQLFNLNTSNGLSASSVQSVIEGKDGAIWISTKLGVDRYNGQRVQHYAMPQVGNKARTNFMMYRLLCDEDGSMLVYDNKGAIYIYNEALDAFVLLYDLNAIVGSDIIPNGMMTDGKGGFWLALNQGFCHFSSADSLQWIERNIAFNHITQYGDRLLVGNSEGLYAYAVSGEKQEKICNNTDIRSSYFDPQSQLLWIGTFNEGLLVYNSRRKSLCNWPSLSRIPTTPVRVIRVSMIIRCW